MRTGKGIILREAMNTKKYLIQKLGSMMALLNEIKLKQLTYFNDIQRHHFLVKVVLRGDV